ncbi:MAG TPA: carboxypeptidase regulatory-like domain-containing protein, partial [Sulfurospirillum arcachonense]|nr:carboxypeptidase regulatory-like domain-containing protein [Sulfurospirillum arcachonense]
MKVKEIDYANSELIFETEHFSTFWIGKHGICCFREKSSFGKWDERGSDIISIRGISFKKYGPYHYLADSLDSYCTKKGIDETVCNTWIKYFQSKKLPIEKEDSEITANKIDYAYKSFFEIANNYQLFNNLYYTWGLSLSLPDFPGNNGNDAKGKYKVIYDYMYKDSIEGEIRKVNFGNFLSQGFSTYLSATSVRKLVNDSPLSANVNNLVYESKFIKTLGAINTVYINSSELLNELENEDIYTTETVIYKKIADFIGTTLLGNVPILGTVYTEVFKYGRDLIDRFDNSRFQNSYTFNTTSGTIESKFNIFFYNVTHDAFNTTNFTKYYVDTFGSLIKEDSNGSVKLVSKSEAKKMADYLINPFLSEIDIEKSLPFLSGLYLTLKNYAYIKFDEKYRKELILKTRINGAKIALAILQYSGEVKADDLIYTKKAKVWTKKEIGEYLLNRKKGNKLQKRFFQKSEEGESEIVTIPVLDSFDKFLEQIKINIPESKWDNIEIKKVSLSIDKYTIESEASTDTMMLTFKMTEFESNSDFSKSNIAKDGFILANEKYSQSLASIFDDLDSSEFQDSFVVVKANILITLNGVDRVVSKEYQFINYLDSDDELITDPEYGKLTSAIRDAVSSEPIADARVTLLPIDITNNTDESGNYSFSKLPPNTYDVRVAKEGYKTVTIYDVTLADGEVKNIEVLLAIDNEHAENNGTATIVLKDALNGDVVMTGYVKVREGQNNKTGDVIKEITDGGNSISLNLIPNTYTVEVGANGYTRSFNTVTILGDLNGAYEFSITPVLSADQVRAVLTWSDTPSDLDSHLVRKTNGSQDYHIFYGDMRPS